MRTIVIFVQTRNVDLAAEEPLVITTHENFQDVAVASSGEISGADGSRIDNEVASPFWTWFIENPRPTLRHLSVVLLT
jgi:hypothetical protein